MSEPLILEDITIALGGRHLLSVNTIVEPGAVLTVMGPSGSGKSTLLSLLSGHFDRAFSYTGRVLCGALDITKYDPQDRHAGLLFQDPLLFPHMSVGGNLMFAMPPGNRTRTQRRAAAEEALCDVGLTDHFDRDPDTLSGGQAARVALARTLLSRPAFVLLDEPFSKLDTVLRGQMRELVFSTARKEQWPVVLVTHDLADAQAAGGEIITIGDVPGV